MAFDLSYRAHPECYNGGDIVYTGYEENHDLRPSYCWRYSTSDRCHKHGIGAHNIMSGSNITVRITISDVNNDPITGANVSVQQQQAITDINGQVTFTPPDSPDSITLQVRHPDYISEFVTFSGNVILSTHNNPLLRRSAPLEAPALSVILGRYAPSPVKLIEEPLFTTLAKAKSDIGGVIGERIDAKSSDSPLQYRNTWMFKNQTTCANTTLTPDPDVSVDKKAGWQRINSVDLPEIEPLQHGRLFWLQSQVSAASPKPWVALVWSPNFTGPSPTTSVDMMFFYTPSTDWVVAKYPYGVVMFKDDKKPKDPPVPDQTYMSIGNKYSWEQMAMVYSLIARNRNAVLIIPMSERGHQDPMLAQEGVWRLCKEVMLFLHREHRFSNIGMKLAESTVLQPRIRAGATLRDYGFIAPRALDFGPIPTIRKLVVGCFSAGASPAKWMMEPENWSLDESLRNLRSKWVSKYGSTWINKDAFAAFPDRLWGCSSPREARVPERKAQFHQAWTEWWDMDGFNFLGKVSIWHLYLPLLDEWHQAQQGRVLRLCHSDGRRPRRILNPVKDKDDSTGLWDRLKKQGIIYKSLKTAKCEARPIEEVHGDLWSVIALSSVYLNARPQPIADKEAVRFPSLIAVDDHNATFRIAWGHCITSSDVGTAR
jgi:hypothetical protein